MRKFKRNEFGGFFNNVGVQIILIIWCVILLYPILWLFYSSLKPSAEIRQHIFSLPKSLYLENYKVFLHIPDADIKALRIDMGRYLLNSTIVTVTSLALVIAIALFAAYAIAKIKFPGRNSFLMGLILLIGISELSLIIPLYYFFSNLNLLNTHWGLIFSYVALNLPFSIIILQSYFRIFPNELIEAAYIDGASRTRAFLTVVVPVSKGAIGAVLMVSFINMWNEFVIALTLNKSDYAKTITAGLMQFRGVYVADWGPMFAGLVGSIIPTIMIYLIFSKHLMKGLSAGAIKG